MNDEPLPSVTCGSCEVTGCVVRFQRTEVEDVRGVPVRVTKILRRCENCGGEFQSDQDPDWYLDAFRGYREAKGWITPERIVEWRTQYDLSQDDVTALLGWGGATLGRYERGALQSEAHNAQITQLMAEGGLMRALRERPDALSQAKKAALRSRLVKEFNLPAPEEVRAAREKRSLSVEEADALVGASGEWSSWETGTTFPDARAGRLVRLLLENADMVEKLRSVSPGIPAKPVSPKMRTLNGRSISLEGKAFWEQSGNVGFHPKKLRALFPDWAEDAEAHRTANVELGAFAQLHVGFLGGADGQVARLHSPQALLKATVHRSKPGHEATLAMAAAVARLVARATVPAWSGSFPLAEEVRETILASTNRGHVDFENLAGFMWARGVPVIYLPELPVKAKGMDGMVTRADGRPVIVLCKKQSLSDWMLFVLGHEAGHVGCGHLNEEEGSAVVEMDVSTGIPTAADGDQAEIEANDYAQRILVHAGGELKIAATIPPAEELAEAAIQYGQEHRISPGHCVLNAMRNTPHPPFNLAPVSMAALKIIDKRLGLPSTAETCRSLAARHIDRTQLRPDSVEFLGKLGVL